MSRYPLRAVLGTALLLLPAGCAKGPNGPLGNTGLGKQLVITMTVRGQIDLVNDYYFVVFNVNDIARNGFTGPVPVVTDFERSGNGFGGGAFTAFVECHQGQGQGASFSINAISSDLLTPTYIGQPTQATVSGNTFQFTIPLAAIAQASSMSTGTSISEGQIQNLEINFINTNVVPVDPQFTGVKYFDALGDPTANSTNDFIQISPGENTQYMNATSPPVEQEGDVATYDGAGNIAVVQGQGPTDTPPAAISNLDIINWTLSING